MNEALKAVVKSLLELSEAITKLTEAHPEEPEGFKEPEVIRLEDVRKVLAGISQRGKTSEMKELLSKFGAVKLSDIEPSKYSELITAAKEIAGVGGDKEVAGTGTFAQAVKFGGGEYETASHSLHFLPCP